MNVTAEKIKPFTMSIGSGDLQQLLDTAWTKLIPGMSNVIPIIPNAKSAPSDIKTANTRAVKPKPISNAA